MTAFFTIFGAALTGFGLVTDGNGRRSMLSSLLLTRVAVRSTPVPNGIELAAA